MAILLEIFAGEEQIGCATISDLDPPMGVASGIFRPAKGGDRNRQYYTDYSRDSRKASKAVRVQRDDGSEISNIGVAISHFPEADIIELFWRNESLPSYFEMFSEHWQYRAYYDLESEASVTQSLREKNANEFSIEKSWLVSAVVILTGVFVASLVVG